MLGDVCGFSDSSSEDEDDDNEWLNNKPKQTVEQKEEADKEKIHRANLVNHIKQGHLDATSLKDMKHSIYRNQSNKRALPAAPPPLQGFHDNTETHYNRNTNKYKIKKAKRTHLDIKQSMPPTKYVWKINPKITGVSAMTSVGCKLKLNDICNEIRNVEFRPEEFVALRVALKNPSVLVSVFSNGKLTTQGGKSKFSCVVALRKVSRMLSQLPKYKGIITEITKPTFYGIQANALIDNRINLQLMAETCPKHADYSPDIQSAYLNWRNRKKYGDKGSCHVYHGGRLMIMGCSNVDIAARWLDDMYPICKPFFFEENEEKEKEQVCTNQEFKQMLKHLPRLNTYQSGDEGDIEPPIIAPPPLS